METQISQDPNVAEFMRLVGEKPLLDRETEQRLGVLMDRQRYAEQLMKGHRREVGAMVAIGIARRLGRLSKIARAAAILSGNDSDPTLSQLAKNRAFRRLVDHKVSEDNLTALSKLLTDHNVNAATQRMLSAGNDQPSVDDQTQQKTGDIKRLVTQVSRDTLCLTETTITILGHVRISELNRAVADKSHRWLLSALSDQIHRELLDFVKEGQQAQDEMSECNMRLVVHTARNFINNNMQLIDLSQEGALGLIDAARRFDHRLGWKFSTYATTWIRHRILKALVTMDRTIRIPQQKHKLAMHMYYAEERLLHEMQGEPTPADIAREMGLTVEQVTEIQRIDQEPQSLDAIIWEDTGATQLDRLAADAPTTEEMAIERLMAPAVRDALSILDEREQTVLIMRYGLDDDSPSTITDISAAIHTSKDRARVIERQALTKLRTNPEVLCKLRDYIDFN